MQEINYMLDLHSFVWSVRKIVNVMQDHVSAGVSVSVNVNRRKCLKKKLTEFSLCFRSAQSELEAMFTFTDTATVKLFTAENESSCKTAVSLDTHLEVHVIAGFGHYHLEY